MADEQVKAEQFDGRYHQAVFLPTIPEFQIRVVRSTSTNRGYHETEFEVISRTQLQSDDLKRLDECRLLGTGQTYVVLKAETLTDNAPAVTVSKTTGLPVPHVVPRAWNGERLTSTVAYPYYKYTVRRICDSGD